MASPQTLLITGATGFLGSHLARAWLRAGHRVAILKRRTSRLDRLAAVLDRLHCFDIEDGIEQPFKVCGPFAGAAHARRPVTNYLLTSPHPARNLPFNW